MSRLVDSTVVACRSLPFIIVAALAGIGLAAGCDSGEPTAVAPEVMAPQFEIGPATTLLAQFDEPRLEYVICDSHADFPEDIGMAVCPAYGYRGAIEGDELPDNVDADVVLGCTVLGLSSLAFDFDETNSSGFEEFAARLMDDVNEAFWSVRFAVDDQEDRIDELMFAYGTDEEALGEEGLAALADASLDAVRLIVNDIDFSAGVCTVGSEVGSGYELTTDFTWQFFGRLAPQGEIDFLQEEVASTDGPTDSDLLATLNAAENSSAKGNATAACNELRAFINQVEAEVQSGRLDAEVGATWIAHAENAIDQLCPA